MSDRPKCEKRQAYLPLLPLLPHYGERHFIVVEPIRTNFLDSMIPEETMQVGSGTHELISQKSSLQINAQKLLYVY